MQFPKELQRVGAKVAINFFPCLNEVQFPKELQLANGYYKNRTDLPQ